MTQGSTISAISIAHLERETGISKDTLRVWERRYGFPTPIRDANDERLYPAEQVERLRVIRRLMDGGARPGKIVPLPLHELHSRVRSQDEATAPNQSAAAHGEVELLEDWLSVIRAHDAGELRRRLAEQLAHRGLRQFILELIVPLNARIGEEWLKGNIEVFEEHLYTEHLQRLLQHALSQWSSGAQAPRVLLTTLPGEAHQLGLLMAQAIIAMDGADCVSLGATTPVAEIVKAAAGLRADIVGLSCGSIAGLRAAVPQLHELRARLEPRIPLWLGGAPSERAPAGIAGITPFPSLLTIPAALGQWRAARTQVNGG